MKGIRFYQEFVHKGKNTDIPKNICLAVFTDTRRIERYFRNSLPVVVFDCADSVCDTPDFGYCMGSVAQEYLADKCRRVSESKAREVAPELFAYLEA